jgi:hypothetical protein
VKEFYCQTIGDEREAGVGVDQGGGSGLSPVSRSEELWRANTAEGHSTPAEL